MYLKASEALKQLRAHARANGLVFKQCSFTYNNSTQWSFYSDCGREGEFNTLSGWRDTLMNEGIGGIENS